MRGALEYFFIVFALPFLIAGAVWAFAADHFDRGKRAYELFRIL